MEKFTPHCDAATHPLFSCKEYCTECECQRSCFTPEALEVLHKEVEADEGTEKENLPW